MRNAIITTAEDLDDPDYYIKVRKANVFAKKKIIDLAGAKFSG